MQVSGVVGTCKTFIFQSVVVVLNLGNWCFRYFGDRGVLVELLQAFDLDVFIESSWRSLDRYTLDAMVAPTSAVKAALKTRN